MSKSIYLSVDMDYWAEPERSRRAGLRTLKKLIASGKPIVVVEDHGNMLDHINRYPSDRLVNVDAHSDFWNYKDFNDRNFSNRSYFNQISNCSSCVVDCSNWVNGVRWQDGKEYVWLHPHADPDDRSTLGECHGGSPDPFYKTYRPKHTWFSTVRRHDRFRLDNLKNVRAIGIAISAEFLPDEKNEKDIRKIIADSGLIIKDTLGV